MADNNRYIVKYYEQTQYAGWLPNTVTHTSQDDADALAEKLRANPSKYRDVKVVCIDANGKTPTPQKSGIGRRV